MNKKGWFIGIGIIAVIILLIPLIMFSPIIYMSLKYGIQTLLADKNGAMHIAEKTLEERYHQEFIVSNAKYFDVFDHFEMEAVPKDQPESSQKFNVAVYKSSNKTEVRDDYQIRKDILPLLQQSFSDSKYFLKVRNTSPGIQLTHWNKEDLIWDEAIKEYPVGFSVDVVVYSLSPDTEELTENEKKGVVKLAENMRNYKYKSSDLYFNRLKPSTVSNSAAVQEILEKGAESEGITSTCVVVDFLDVSRTEDIVCY
ncbi:hypothetical protein BBG47_21065 [Paenibacillus sp. KS1]|uniref:hypothetical protein n=1 Tax=Paenibacillus sp. KS1 TaxID=1849249 RepID=UPI0008066EBB|nr:hypothetical protein [Paenibacillus sp. KS1]OBY77596.1 hypothetical protein BBG47_21065 [Paenibacillus sp. KS1]